MTEPIRPDDLTIPVFVRRQKAASMTPQPEATESLAALIDGAWEAWAAEDRDTRGDFAPFAAARLAANGVTVGASDGLRAAVLRWVIARDRYLDTKVGNDYDESVEVQDAEDALRAALAASPKENPDD